MKKKKNILDKNWIRNAILISILFSGIVNTTYFFVEQNARTCSGFFCGFSGYIIAIPLAFIIGLIISVNLLSKNVIKDWNILGLVLLGTIATGFPISIIFAVFLSKTLAIYNSNGYNYFPILILAITMVALISVSLIAYTWILINYSSKFIVVLGVSLVSIFILNGIFSYVENNYYNPKLVTINHVNYQNEQLSLNKNNAQTIIKTGLIPYKPSDLEIGNPKLFKRFSATTNPNFLQLSYGGIDIYEFNITGKLIQSKCGTFDPTLSIGYTIPIHPCMPVGMFQGNTIYYSSIDPIGVHPASSAYYVQIGQEVITLSDYLQGVLNQNSAIQMINSMQHVSALTLASL